MDLGVYRSLHVESGRADTMDHAGLYSGVLQGGIGFMIIWLVCLAAMFLLYLPFFKMDDARAFQEEQAMGIAEEEKELVLAQEGE